MRQDYRKEILLEGTEASAACLYGKSNMWLDGWVWSNGGMVLTGENWSAGRKTLYSVGGRWMDEYGAMVE